MVNTFIHPDLVHLLEIQRADDITVSALLHTFLLCEFFVLLFKLLFYCVALADQAGLNSDAWTSASQVLALKVSTITAACLVFV